MAGLALAVADTVLAQVVAQALQALRRVVGANEEAQGLGMPFGDHLCGDGATEKTCGTGQQNTLLGWTREDPSITDDIDPLTRSRLQRHRAGEAAERRQQGQVLADQETRQAHLLAATAAQAVRRMHMARQYMPLRVRAGLVVQGERAERQRLGHHLDAQPGRRITGMPVMVATHQSDGQRRMAGAPLGKGRQGLRGPAFGAVQEVAEKYQVLAGKALQQGIQALQVAGGGATGHRLAQCPVAGGLAQMQVGDQQGPPL
ncbi:hypothetical protein WR25_24491 [Diploscapter pachys]|uniref:Uncharacterized protein n=1 Tax=Diploscapter pachys TaxID=2018661 RepID=A0A2A2KHN4_9BILA|nr:hypothetical protein WR25_24491 [Diploscapter pachys]